MSGSHTSALTSRIIIPSTPLAPVTLILSARRENSRGVVEVSVAPYETVAFTPTCAKPAVIELVSRHVQRSSCYAVKHTLTPLCGDTICYPRTQLLPSGSSRRSEDSSCRLPPAGGRASWYPSSMHVLDQVLHANRYSSTTLHDVTWWLIRYQVLMVQPHVVWPWSQS
ncbi:hypothetical protein OH76DRAFT_1418607 [Lentinus brumalis]|uniref:Uncharacterized protein n=1 Tax=Lentinus brumalis TaxID=2498619 RepID=A0A371D979_9APHY|nr:hypothetical protein OH76DRAFT_1418607 [Polyporus brumalis]